MKIRIVATLALLSLPTVSSGQVQEVWQTRLLKGMETLQTEQRAHAASIEQLKFATEDATMQARSASVAMKQTGREADRACATAPGSPECRQARVQKSNARLGLIEAGVSRLKALSAVTRQHHKHALGSAEKLHALIRAIERDARVGAKSGPAVSKAAARLDRYVSSAITQLERLPATKTQGRARGAALAKLRVMQRMGRGPNGHKNVKAPLERLRGLQAQLELVATLSTQAGKALTDRALRLRTETTIGGIHDLMQVGGTVKETYVEYSQNLTNGIQALDDDIRQLQEGNGDIYADGDDPGAVFEEMEPEIF